MDSSLEELLQPDVLTASYQQVETVRETPLTDVFMANAQDVDDDTFRFYYRPADVKPAPINHPGGSARVLEIGTAKERFMSLFTVFNSQEFNMSVFNALREPDSRALQRMGRTTITDVLGVFAERHRTLKEVAIAKILSDGIVYANESGEILESSSGATYTADFGVPSGNKTDIGGIITDLFSEPTANIPQMLEQIDDTARQNKVPAPKHVWLHKLNLQYLRENDYFVEWAVRMPDFAQRVLNGEAIEDLWGKTWHFLPDYYEAQDGTTKPMIGRTKAIFTPDPNGTWKKAVRGPTIVPKSVGLADSVDAALNQMDQVWGEFAYAAVEHNPARIMGFFGDKWGFGFAEPSAVFQATAFPAS